jgi:hypothetical protein
MHGFSEDTHLPAAAPLSPSDGITIDDFVAYLPTHDYVFIPTREPWVRGGVNAKLPPVPVLDRHGRPKLRDGKPVLIKPSKWLDENRAVEQLAWCPGEPKLIHDRLVKEGGWTEREGVQIFNMYEPPRIELGDTGQAGPWIDHLRRIYPQEAEHCLNWFAHRAQRPGEKINHGLVLGGPPGIGKDSLLEPLKHTVGPWNFHDVTPSHLLASFNAYARSVILRINEARDLGEASRFNFYDRTKIYLATPPDVIRVNEKYIREHYIFNVMGFVLTTNHRTDGIYLPADDRRHYVAWSYSVKENFAPGYWTRLWHWYLHEGGLGHVAAFLHARDLSGFDHKAPPPQTEAFWAIVNVGLAPEDAELADLLDAMGKSDPKDPDKVIRPDAVTQIGMIAAANGPISEWLMDRRNRRAFPHRMSRNGYEVVRNPEAKDGAWKFKERRAVYARASLSPPQREAAARALVEQDREEVRRSGR